MQKPTAKSNTLSIGKFIAFEAGKKRRLALLFPVLLILLVMAGCSSSNSEKTATAAGNKAIESSTAGESDNSQGAGAGNSASNAAGSDVPDLSKVTLSVGQTGWGNLETGFKAAGLLDTPYKVEFNVFQGGNLQLEAMGAGHLDLAYTSEIPPIFASQAEGGGHFKIIAVQVSNTLQQELIIPKGSPIKSVAELKGKKVAYVSSTTAHYFLLKMLEQAGLKWEDIEPVELSTADGLTALVSGKVDALASYGNAIIAGHQNGATTLADAKDILSGNFLVEAADSAIADPGKHAAIADFLNRMNQFYDWTRSHQEEWAKLTADNTHQPLEQALNTLQKGEAQRSTKITAISPEAIQSEQDIADTLAGVQLLKQKIEVSGQWSDAFSAELQGK